MPFPAFLCGESLFLCFPALSIAAASTEGWLYKNVIDASDQMSGFMQRMIYYVVKHIPFEEISLEHRDGNNLAELLRSWESGHFRYWRGLPGQHYLTLEDAAVAWKNEVYKAQYLRYFKVGNDNVMSYFTRIFDNYLYKFCMLIWLTDIDPYDIQFMYDPMVWKDYVIGIPVTLQQFKQAWYLCQFYMANVIPLLDIIDERDKLYNERRLLDILVRRFKGYASHSSLLNTSHMKKREFSETIESLLEREAVTCESGQRGVNNKVPKMYRVDPDILKSWTDNEVDQVLTLRPDLLSGSNSPDSQGPSQIHKN